MSIRILLVDDHKIMRGGLRRILENLDNIEVIGEAGDGLSAVKKAKDLCPHIVIMDIGIPGFSGIEATRQINCFRPSVKIIALSMHSERKFVKEMLKAGAHAYLLKDRAFEELAQAIKTVQVNQFYFSAGIEDEYIKDYARNIRKINSSAHFSRQKGNTKFPTFN